MSIIPSQIKEVEVFRLIKFEENKYYEFALKTRTHGRYPDKKHYTTNELKYLGKYMNSKTWGYGDNHSGSEHFVDNDVNNIIEYDYEGQTCFREVQCKTASIDEK